MIFPDLIHNEVTRKQRIMGPILDRSSFSGVFVRKRETKSGLPRFYLYNQDLESLVLAAEAHHHGDTVFRISLSSTAFVPKDPHSLGSLYNKEYSPWYIGKQLSFINTGREQETIGIKYLRKYERKDQIKKMSIIFLPEDEYYYSDSEEEDQTEIKQVDFKLFPKYISSIKAKSSSKNVLFLQNQRHVFSFGKIDDDEYYLTVSNPLSIFQGFCIALSLFKKIQNEA